MHTSANLTLGTRKDSQYWTQECRNQLGYEIGAEVRESKPSLDKMVSVFTRSDDWIFFGGHFTSMDHLFNDDRSVSVKFLSDKIVLNHDGVSRVLVKGEECKQHEKLKVIFWGGCNVHSFDEIRNNLRILFGNPMMIGWRSVTGWQILHSVMGGFGNEKPHAMRDFFDRVKVDSESEQTVREAWLATARDTIWGDSTPAFSIYDSLGTEHTL
jgi:hypothetical protein